MPPTVTDTQLQTALERGMLTQEEYDLILASKMPEAPEEPETP